MKILKQEVPVNDRWNTRPGIPLHVGSQYPSIVTFWHASDTVNEREYRVFATGQEIPPEAVHEGTVVLTALGLVWHLFSREVQP